MATAGLLPATALQLRGARAARTAPRRAAAARCCAAPLGDAAASNSAAASPAAVPRLARRVLIAAAAATPALAAAAQADAKKWREVEYELSDKRDGAVAKSDAEWKAALSPDAYRVLRRAVTEKQFTSPLLNEKRRGAFVCAGCGTPLFASEAKFDSGTGWPSFNAVLPGAVRQVEDLSLPFFVREEIRCVRCEGHLGHVFNDGPQPTGLRFCMNGAALAFVPAADAAV